MTVKITENARQLVFMQESIGFNHAVGNETGKSGIDRGDRYGFCRKKKKKKKIKANGPEPAIIFCLSLVLLPFWVGALFPCFFRFRM